MATYSVSCVGAKLTLDTDQQTVTIQRDPNVLMALPAETVLPVSKMCIRDSCPPVSSSVLSFLAS